MKLRNFFTILIGVLAILLLIALGGFMTLYTADEANPLRRQMMQIMEPRKADSPADSGDQAAPATVGSTPASPHSFIFVGDSRTIGMGDAVGDSCTYIGAEGQGYNWFAEEGLSLLQSELDRDGSRPVIFNFGVNDPENIKLYVGLYQSVMEQYPQTDFYLLSVNPLVDDEGFNTTNEMIELYNATIESTFPQNYIDSYSYLVGSGYETVDGLHYTDATYQMIHDYVVSILSQQAF